LEPVDAVKRGGDEDAGDQTGPNAQDALDQEGGGFLVEVDVTGGAVPENPGEMENNCGNNGNQGEASLDAGDQAEIVFRVNKLLARIRAIIGEGQLRPNLKLVEQGVRKGGPVGDLGRGEALGLKLGNVVVVQGSCQAQLDISVSGVNS